MKTILVRRAYSAAIAAVLAAIVASSAANAHEGRETGDLELTVGFLQEPAYEGLPNGVSIRMERATAAGSQGHGDSRDAPTGIDGPDLQSHGAAFASGAIPTDGEFHFTFTQEYEGLTVPYHDHLSGKAGIVKVGRQAAEAPNVVIEFDGRGFSPAEVEIRPGDAVKWVNKHDGHATVISGPHTSAAHLTENTEQPNDGRNSPLAPVTGVLGLQVEITHQATGAVKVLSLNEVFDDPGHYVADLIPTAPGAYQFRVFGNVEGEEIDEAFVGGPNTFDEVQPQRVIQFPVELPQPREIEGAARGAQDTARDADDAASRASTLAAIAIIVGAVGIAVGAGGVALALRKPE